MAFVSELLVILQMRKAHFTLEERKNTFSLINSLDCLLCFTEFLVPNPLLRGHSFCRMGIKIQVEVGYILL